jgi:hypothetical protein
MAELLVAATEQVGSANGGPVHLAKEPTPATPSEVGA